jgi:hypothetical protein
MMGRIRSVKPEWLEDEVLAGTSDAARVLSIGLILMADDYGRGRASVAFIATNVWRYEMERDQNNPRETFAKASRALRELVETRFVSLYEVRGQAYFEIRNWGKHQKVDKPSKPRIPAPETEQNQVVTETLARPSRDTRETLVPDLDLDLDLDLDQDMSDSGESSKQRKRKLPSLSPDAERVWDSLPALSRSRSGKSAFATAWKKQGCEDPETLKAILSALPAWVANIEEAYFPGAHRWIQNRRWENPPPAQKPQQTNRPTPPPLRLLNPEPRKSFVPGKWEPSNG